MLFAGFDVYTRALRARWRSSSSACAGDLVGASLAYAIGYFGRIELLQRHGASPPHARASGCAPSTGSPATARRRSLAASCRSCARTCRSPPASRGCATGASSRCAPRRRALDRLLGLLGRAPARTTTGKEPALRRHRRARADRRGDRLPPRALRRGAAAPPPMPPPPDVARRSRCHALALGLLHGPAELRPSRPRRTPSSHGGAAGARSSTRRCASVRGRLHPPGLHRRHFATPASPAPATARGSTRTATSPAVRRPSRCPGSSSASRPTASSKSTRTRRSNPGPT